MRSLLPNGMSLLWGRKETGTAKNRDFLTTLVSMRCLVDAKSSGILESLLLCSGQEGEASSNPGGGCIRDWQLRAWEGQELDD